MSYLSQLVKKFRNAFSSQFTRDIERKKTGRRLYDIVDESIPADEIKSLAESMHGEPARLAVPIFHNGKWQHDIKKICNPEKAYRDAIKPKLYEIILGFIYR